MAGDQRSAGVAAEAMLHFAFVHATAQRGIRRTRRVCRVAGGEVERVRIFVESETSVKADATFVPCAVALIDVGLSFVCDAESPPYRSGSCVSAVGYGVGAAFVVAEDFVVQRREIAGEALVVTEDFGGSSSGSGVGHGRGGLRGGFVGVALGAFGGAGEPRAGGEVFGRPPD